MLKFTTKREVDRHVAQMTKNLSENEVNKRNKTFRQACLEKMLIFGARCLQNV